MMPYDFSAVHLVSKEYLRLHPAIADYLGGLHWSDEFDGLLLANGEVFAGSKALAQFLDGFGSQQALAAFGIVLLWVDLFLNPRCLKDAQVTRLEKLFISGGSNWRNAGVFAALLCQEVPRAANPPPAEMISRRLRDQSFPIRWFSAMHNSNAPGGEAIPVAPGDFRYQMLQRLRAYADEELASWLQFGRGTVKEASDRLAEERPPPRTLGSMVSALLERPRLAGAQAYLGQMVGALSLPARREAPQQLPVGGYADLVTHGSVDHLLPSQHALEDIEFCRRFAENELLFFRREEPPTQNREQLVVLLDQGVRTWGDVRLVLSAATLALTQQAGRRKVPFSLALTSNDGRLLDPLNEPVDQLGKRLEASDFSFHPGLALEGVLESPGEELRDIVLLTHPRNVREPDVQIAARRLVRKDRLFAMTLDANGSAELVQLHRGLPIRLRQFQVRFTPSRAVVEKSTGTAEWSGDIESCGWPFRFGTDGAIRLYSFDDDGRYLFAVMASSMLHAWDLNSGDSEILPRPCLDSVLLTRWLDLIGVCGGFVLVGVHRHHYVLAHYDLSRRHCKIHHGQPWLTDDIETRYIRSLHSIVLAEKNSRKALLALDLATGAYALSGERTSNRAAQARELFQAGECASRNVETGVGDLPASATPRIYFDPLRESIRVTRSRSPGMTSSH